MNDDERFEQFVREAAVDYRAPQHEVPREAMWEAIRARRHVARPTAAPTPRPRTTPRAWIWVGMAATLLLGVGLGRTFRRGDSVAAPTVASVPQTPSASTTPTPAPALPSTARELAAPTQRATDAGHRAPGGTARVDGFSVASAAHLQSVQLLLSSFASSPGDARSDSAIAVWAKQLLGDTRLLLDSPAARDPQRARLLQDLEVILVQLVQRSPGGDAEARDAVERTLQKKNLMPRLRSAVPASLSSGTD